MRMRTFAMLTSLTALFGCPSDDDDSTTDQTTTGPTTTSPTTTDGSSSDGTVSTSMSTSMSTTDSTETSTVSTTDTTESGSETTGPADSSSGSESGGGGVCELYCTAYETNCTEFGDQYNDHQACLDACGGWDPGEPGAMSGDNAECRLYHAGAAAADPETHCPHAQENPTDQCV